MSTDGRGPLDLDDSDDLQGLRTYISLANTQTSMQLRHQQQYVLQFPPTLLFTQTTGGASGWPFVANYSSLAQAFPANVHLLSLIHLNETFNPILVRLVHIYEAGDDPVLSLPATIQLADIFAFATIVSVDERTLTGVHAVSYLDSLGPHSTPRGGPARVAPSKANGFSVTLQPTEIRTFYVTFEANAKTA